MKKPTVVLVAHDVGGRGGMERHLEELINRLKSDVTLIVVACTLNLSNAENLRFVRIPIPSKPVPLKMILFAIAASIRILFLKYDILHTTGAIVFNRANISTVHFCHAGFKAATGDTRTQYQENWLRQLNSMMASRIALLMERLVYKPHITKNLVAVSKRVKLELLEHFPYVDDSINVIPNGVDVSRFRPFTFEEKRAARVKHTLPPNGTFVIFMGGDWSRKGLEYLVHAFGRIAIDEKDVHLIVVGSGDAQAYIKFISPVLRDRVHFVGSQPDPEVWLALSDIFVFPSSYETFSLVVHEAAAVGLNILSTRVGGVEDLIQHGQNGLFINRDITDVALKLRGVVENIKSTSFGGLAQKSVQRLTWDSMYDRFRAFYDNI